RPQSLIGIVKEEGESVLAGRAEAEGGGELVVLRQHLGRRRGEHQRRDQRVRGVGQSERGAVLHLRVGVLKRLPQRLRVVRQGGPCQRAGRQLAQRRLVALQERHQRRQGRRV